MEVDKLKGCAVDVICQHNKDGEIIPLRLRLTDEEGERHAYTIKSYRDMSERGAYTTQDGIYVTDQLLVFVCKVAVFGRMQNVRLYYDRTSQIWSMKY